MSTEPKSAAQIEPLGLFDRAAVLALNNANARETSELDRAGLDDLINEAFLAAAIGRADDPEALLITFDQSATYASPNFRWFQKRHSRFVYVDRIIVSSAARGRGHARRLYEDLFARAEEAGHDMVGCEVNLDPPNPGSDAFHEALGFEEIGQATLDNGKTVRYWSKTLV